MSESGKPPTDSGKANGTKESDSSDDLLALAAAHPDAKIVTFAQLSDGGKLVLIRHGDQIYRLSLTKAGRLVLTK